MLKTYRRFVAAGLMFGALTAHADEVLKWNGVLLDAIRTDRTAPPRASRAMAMVHVAMYDAVNAIVQSHEPYHLTAKAAATVSKEAAAASAAHRVLRHLFPAQAGTFDAALNQSLGEVGAGVPKTEGISLGQLSADGIISLRSGDDAVGVSSGPVPAPGPGVWEKTPPGFAPFVLPGWGRVTPWTMTTGSQFRGVGPAALKTGEYKKAFNETKSIGAKESTTRTADQTQIALFWADGPGTATPPGHWLVITQKVSQQKGLGPVENARLFALVSLAVADAAIAAWDMKFHYYNWRPITGIRKADIDGNPHTDPDPNWEPLISTPPFPDYVSGHSTFSEAAAEMLKQYFRSDSVAFSTSSDGLPGVTRSFSRFSAAADEAGLSRIYGGIHFAFADKDAQQAGRKLAHQAFVRFLKPR